jgi:hypothetical protein
MEWNFRRRQSGQSAQWKQRRPLDESDSISPA